MKKRSVLVSAIILAMSAGISYADSSNRNRGTGVTTPGSNLNITAQCRGGGTRTVTGTWDAASGALDVSIEVKNCKQNRDEIHNGITTMTGTLLPAATGSSYDIDLTTHVETAVTGSEHGVDFTQVCDITKKGSFDERQHLFTGSTKTTCDKNGSFQGKDGLLEYLLKPTSNSGEQE